MAAKARTTGARFKSRMNKRRPTPPIPPEVKPEADSTPKRLSPQEQNELQREVDEALSKYLAAANPQRVVHQRSYVSRVRRR
jgi:hypothetical protein